MANLLDGIRKAQKSEIASQLCDFKVNRISVLLHIVWQCIYYAVMYVCRRIMLLFKREIALPPVYFRKKRHEMHYEKYMLLEDEVLLEEIIKTLKAKMHFLGLSVTKSEDRTSAEITKMVARLYPKEELKGLSLLEKNDYIYKNYPRQKRLDENMCLHLWLLVSFFVLAASVIFWISGNEFRNHIVLSCIILEIIWGYFISSKLLQWQFAHFVWLSASGLGHSFAVLSEDTAKHLDDPDKEKNAGELLVYHKLLSLKAHVTEAPKITILADLIMVREEWEKNKLKRRWKKCFPKFEFKEEVFTVIINRFSYYDFERIEQRLAELSQAKDPAALAEKKKMEYKMQFRTLQGDIATLSFTASKDKSKRLCICRIERKDALKEKLLTKEKLMQALKAEEHGISVLYNDYLNSSVPKEEKLVTLKQNVKRLEQQISDAEQQLLQKKAEVSKLNKQINDRERECEEIRNRLAKTGLADSEYETQKQAFLKAQRELPTLKNDCLYFEKQKDEISDKYDTFVSRKDILQEEIVRLQQQLSEERRSFLEELKQAVGEKGKNDRKDMDYLLGEMLIRKIDL